MDTATFHQTAFRGRYDNGDETGAGWVKDVNTNFYMTLDTNFRIRIDVSEVAGVGYGSARLDVFYSHNEAEYVAVSTTSLHIKGVTSSYFATGDDTTQQITAGGTYIANNNGMTETGDAGLCSYAGSDHAEFEYCLLIDSTYVSNGDTIDLQCRVSNNVLASYDITPRITVGTEPSGTFRRRVIIS